VKHLPFQSLYRENFQVVEERQGKFRLYPHTEQLPLLLRALNFEFEAKLPPRIARVDHRADGFHKILRKTAATMFCGLTNVSRPDQLRLHALPDYDLLYRVTIVQHSIEETPRGDCHRFRFYGGEDFFPEILLSGKQIVFANHVLERFSERTPDNLGNDLCAFLMTFYGAPIISSPVGTGRAFMIPYFKSVLAFPYFETEAHYFITSCLSINEIHSLNLELPPHVLNLHYDMNFIRPQIRNWIPTGWMLDLYHSWERKTPPPPTQPPSEALRSDWGDIAARTKDLVLKAGHGPESKISFLDYIPGPFHMETRPGQVEPRIDELDAYKKQDPRYDWDAIFAERDATTATRAKKTPTGRSPRTSSAI
jgi:hypothetical protein